MKKINGVTEITALLITESYRMKRKQKSGAAFFNFILFIISLSLQHRETGSVFLLNITTSPK